MVRSLLIFSSLFLCLAACSTKPVSATESNSKSALDGRWKLVDVDCEDHHLGGIGLESRQSIRVERMEEMMSISGNIMTRDTIDRNDPKLSAVFCEEIDESQLEISGDSVHVKNEQRKSREGHGGYKCYPLTQSPADYPDYSMRFKIDGKKLTLMKKNISVKIQNDSTQSFCQNGGEVLEIYERL